MLKMVYRGSKCNALFNRWCWNLDLITKNEFKVWKNCCKCKYTIVNKSKEDNIKQKKGIWQYDNVWWNRWGLNWKLRKCRCTAFSRQ